MERALELRGITKRFGRIVANDGVDFDLRAGEVHALLGENGAGKSTLMSILYGLYRPDEGEVLVDGRPVTIESPRAAIDLGIGMVHQHFMLIPVMTVAENIVLADEPRTRGGLLDVHAAAARVRELSDRFGLAVSPDATIEDVSVGQQQRVEILRALYRDAKILVLDEPTAVLTAQETQDLFAVLRALRDDGKAIVFISHKLGEVLDIADRVTVLRRGKRIDTVPTEGATEASLARLMVGRDVLLRVDKAPLERREPILEVRNLRVRDDRDLPAVRGVDLTVHAGEVVALAGVEGNGQSELVEALTGLRHVDQGAILVEGRDRTGAGARAMVAAGVSHIAEDRHRRGLVLNFSIAENLALREYRTPKMSRFGWLSSRRMIAAARSLIREFDVRGGEPQTLAAALSGGNQQKVVIAREIAANPRVLVAAQPTRGLDVGAIEFVHRRLVAEREAGRGILLMSLESEEVRSLADRILVIYEGRIVGEFPPDASEEELGIAMTGGGRREAA
ncbi:MAG: ral nucleoside transport system ATP-binding protein [Solirubrobacteraceae bacterium]|jgi:simple sugar transport system ATP-binding protein|nr:ral nucleoside transport system ATP-binding protein [Solirubrobacteraceae bacterium]